MRYLAAIGALAALVVAAAWLGGQMPLLGG